MNIAVLVGNGFDLAAGLQTGPNDFINNFVSRYSREEDKQAVGQENKFAAACQLAQQIKKDGIETWADFEKQFGLYAKNFGSETASNLVNQHDVFIDYLGKWLSSKENTLSDGFVERNASQCFESLTSFQEKLPPRQKKSVNKLFALHRSNLVHWNVLSFNYTGVLYKLYEYCGGKGSAVVKGKHFLGDFIHVHGDLKGRIVCGLDGADQIHNEDFQSNSEITDLLVKPNALERVLYLDNDQRGFEHIQTSDMIIVFGMSLGDTDRRWWRVLLNRMNDNKNVLTIITYYPSKETFATHSPAPLRRNDIKFRKLLLSFADFELEEHVRDNIIVMPSGYLFPMDLTKLKNVLPKNVRRI